MRMNGYLAGSIQMYASLRFVFALERVNLDEYNLERPAGRDRRETKSRGRKMYNFFI